MRRRALADVVVEVQHQNEKWGPSHDFYQHANGELLRAAKVMLAVKGRMPGKDWKDPSSLTRREQLVRSAAFIVAEINRMDATGENTPSQSLPEGWHDDGAF